MLIDVHRVGVQFGPEAPSGEQQGGPSSRWRLAGCGPSGRPWRTRSPRVVGLLRQGEQPASFELEAIARALVQLGVDPQVRPIHHLPVDLTGEVVANHPNPPYLLALGIGWAVAALTLVALVYLAAREAPTSARPAG